MKDAVCPNCSTKNRAAARFCISCTHSLAAETVLLADGDDYQPTEIDLANHHPAFSEHALPDGTLIEGFRIVRPIGEGGFGIVYLAWDAALERHVAIKEYMPSALVSRSDASLDLTMRSDRHRETFEAGLRSFVNEARLLARFDHPSLVKVFRFWEANRTAYMAMPFYEGPTLKNALVALRGPVTERQLRDWIGPLLDALTVIHKERCFHRDISPDNILLTPSGPLLLDFGAARRVITDRTQALTTMLKPGFAPIEQYGGEMLQGAWTDLYALAGVVHYAITGRPPVASVSRVVNDTVQPLARTHAGRYSDAFLRAIDAALSVRPEARPQDVAQFRASLDAGGVGTAAVADIDLPDPKPAEPVQAMDEVLAESTASLPIQHAGRAPSNETIDDYTLFVPPADAVHAQRNSDAGFTASERETRDAPLREPVADSAFASLSEPVAAAAASHSLDRRTAAQAPRQRRAAMYLVPAMALLIAAGAGWWSLGNPTPDAVAPTAAQAISAAPTASAATVSTGLAGNATAPGNAPEAVAAVAAVAAAPASSPAIVQPATVATAPKKTQASPTVTATTTSTAAAAATAATAASPAAPANRSLAAAEKSRPIVTASAATEPARHAHPATEVASTYNEASKPPRCGDLVLKSSLETLNSEERGFLKSSCR